MTNPLNRPYDSQSIRGRTRTAQDPTLRPGRDGNSRADVVLFFGILSLFLCVPLGIIAWIMGSSDLRKIRSGILLPVKVGTLKIGRALGIAGTAIFAVTLVFSVFVAKHGIQFADWGIEGIDSLMHPAPLPLSNISFAGEWYGMRGTFIRIRSDGTGDFRSQHTTVTGGRVKITGDSLSIGLLGLAKTWHIDRRPYVKNGVWHMKLDGEEFARKAKGQLVRQQKTIVTRKWVRSASQKALHETLSGKSAIITTALVMGRG